VSEQNEAGPQFRVFSLAESIRRPAQRSAPPETPPESEWTDSGWSIGDFAYEAYTPAKVGVVIHVNRGPYVVRSVVVRKVNGEEVVIRAPQRFEALVEDHRRKLQRHEATLERLRAIPTGS
jgi:hypothetical protein